MDRALSNTGSESDNRQLTLHLQERPPCAPSLSGSPALRTSLRSSFRSLTLPHPKPVPCWIFHPGDRPTVFPSTALEGQSLTWTQGPPSLHVRSCLLLWREPPNIRCPLRTRPELPTWHLSPGRPLDHVHLLPAPSPRSPTTYHHVGLTPGANLYPSPQHPHHPASAFLASCLVSSRSTAERALSDIQSRPKPAPPLKVSWFSCVPRTNHGLLSLASELLKLCTCPSLYT